MVKILAQQPKWLQRNSAGFDLFHESAAGTGKSAQLVAKEQGPSRRIAQRGTEVFTIVGQELRWADLGALKESGEQKGAGARTAGGGYKILKAPISRPVQQLSVSPAGDFLAIVTSHTCHVCVLPPSEKLAATQPQIIKLRSFQVGPTAHVLERSPVATAIWHPLSPTGNGLVTITKDACVRLWELDSQNRNSFDEPSLAVDLKKLGNASSTREDFSASKFGTNKAYSLDDVEMQVAAGCFGGRGEADEDGWSSMTLWIAMTEGDVYALCPFLPSQFWMPPTLLPSLTTNVAAKSKMLAQDSEASVSEKLVADHQSKWLAEMDKQEPYVVPGEFGTMEIYTRPERPTAVPKLQGPFQVAPEPGFGEITDIHVIAPRINDDDLYGEEDIDDFDLQRDEGLSIAIICLATNLNSIHVCLNLEGVEAEWLPARRTRTQHFESDDEKELLLLETIDLKVSAEPPAGSWPTFTTSPTDRYELFTTQPSGIYSLSFQSWIGLESELAAQQKGTEGLGLRLDVLMSSASTSVQTVTHEVDRAYPRINAAVAAYAPHTDLGYVLLTTTPDAPLATIFDIETEKAHPFAPDAVAAQENLPSRPVYTAPEEFFRKSQLPALTEKWRQESANGARGDMQGELRLSPFTLARLTQAHRILSSETHDLELAAAELYRRCERMISEMRDQIESVRLLANRIDSVTGVDDFSESVQGQPELVRGGRQKINARIAESEAQTKEIKERVDRLKSKIRGLGGKQLTAKERAFKDEVEQVESSILSAHSHEAPTSPARLVKLENSDLTTSTLSSSNPSQPGDQQTVAARFTAVEEMYIRLLDQVATMQTRLERDSSDPDLSSSASTHAAAKASSSSLSHDYRTRKMAQVFGLLDRETAMIEAVAERLKRLQT